MRGEVKRRVGGGCLVEVTQELQNLASRVGDNRPIRIIIKFKGLNDNGHGRRWVEQSVPESRVRWRADDVRRNRGTSDPVHNYVKGYFVWLQLRWPVVEIRKRG